MYVFKINSKIVDINYRDNIKEIVFARNDSI